MSDHIPVSRAELALLAARVGDAVQQLRAGGGERGTAGNLTVLGLVGSVLEGLAGEDAVAAAVVEREVLISARGRSPLTAGS